MKLSNSLTRRTLGALVLAALTIAPMFAVAPSAEAQPRGYGYGRRNNYRRNNRVVVERYRPRYRRPTRRYIAPPRRYAPIRRGHWTTRYRNGRAYRYYVR
jgi:hypothetical protein